jgi:biopolymer transport protein ExbB
VFELIRAAGWPIWFLLVASVIAVALIIERLIVLRSEKIIPQSLFDKVVEAYRKQGVTQQLVDAVYQDSPLGRVLAAGLRTHKAPRPIMKEAIEEEGRAVTHDLERFLTTLGTIASISPLMGLFGTIVGMIEIFGAQAPVAGGATSPEQIAHGVSVALYNTGFGILIAVPATIFFRHFRGKVESFVMTMEQQAARLADILLGNRPD